MGIGVTLDSVSQSYPGVGCVVQKCSLTIAPDAFIALVGPSGCGKSTILRLLLGLEPVQSGRIDFVGAAAGIRPAIGIAFQEPRLLPWLTVAQNIALVLRGTRSDNGRRVEQLLQLVDLQSFARSYPKALSGGMAQRVSLARALANQPDVLLLDEPFSALDALTKLRLQDALVAIHRSHPRTTVLVTHDIDEALFTSQQVIVLSSRPGRILDIVDVPLPYPRDRTDSALLARKARVLDALHIDRHAGGSGRLLISDAPTALSH